ncbi:MAG: DUF4221 family protein [Mongoliitalea sp.]
MQKLSYIVFIWLFWTVVSCNEKEAESRGNSTDFTLEEGDSLVIPLDSVSPPKPPFVQLLEEENLLTFFNAFNRSIYWFDLEEKNYFERTVINAQGANQVGRPVGYHIIHRDSIAVFDMLKNELVFINDKGTKLNAFSIVDNFPMNDSNWLLSYPQFFPRTVTPFILMDEKLIFSGSFMWAIPDKILDTFKFTALFDLSNNELTYTHSYPKSIYGSKFNWDDPYYTTVYYDWNPDKKVMVYSFPISNSLFTASLEKEGLNEVVDSEYGSKVVKPLSKKNPTRELMLSHLMESDIYAGIKYDSYRNVYYRVLMHAVSGMAEAKDLSLKRVSIIIYDSELNVVGKKELGLLKNWNIDNMMVTKDGLLVEYTDMLSSNEDYMVFKLLKLIAND